jgi:signal transduction histidine kinase
MSDMALVETAIQELSRPALDDQLREALVKKVEESGHERALEETREFLAHELRHVAVPLDFFVKRLVKEVSGETANGKTAEYTEVINKQVERLHRLVDRYLEYTRQFAPRTRPTDVNRFLNKYLVALQPEFHRRGIVVASPEGIGPQAQFDSELMGEALHQILLNAIEAMEGGGSLTVASHLEEDQIIVAISDTGTGIAPKYLNQVFELGFTTKLGRTVAGVGLPLARRIIYAHGGQISIANNSNGRGATVTISLPAAKAESVNGK